MVLLGYTYKTWQFSGGRILERLKWWCHWYATRMAHQVLLLFCMPHLPQAPSSLLVGPNRTFSWCSSPTFVGTCVSPCGYLSNPPREMCSKRMVACSAFVQNLNALYLIRKYLLPILVTSDRQKHQILPTANPLHVCLTIVRFIVT